MIIYKVTNLTNGKIYIGQTQKTLYDRKYSHYKKVKQGSNTSFHNALRKYDGKNFKWEIIDKVDNIEKLNFLEEYYIKKFNSFKNGYNLTTGGDNYIRAEETKEKIKQANLGKTHNSETIEKIRNGNIGKSVTNEFRVKMKTVVSGRKHCKKTKEKISKSLIGNKRHLGKKHTEKTKEKISESKKGQPASNRLEVLQLDKDNNIIKKWKSISEAEASLKLHNISEVINGKRKTCGGFNWKKINE